MYNTSGAISSLISLAKHFMAEAPSNETTTSLLASKLQRIIMSLIYHNKALDVKPPSHFFFFIQNNKLQTQIQLQTWTDKKHRTGRNLLGCQKRVPYPVGIINDNTNSDRW